MKIVCKAYTTDGAASTTERSATTAVSSDKAAAAVGVLGSDESERWLPVSVLNFFYPNSVQGGSQDLH